MQSAIHQRKAISIVTHTAPTTSVITEDGVSFHTWIDSATAAPAIPAHAIALMILALLIFFTFLFGVFVFLLYLCCRIVRRLLRHCCAIAKKLLQS